MYKKILLTGGAGFIGSHVKKTLAQSGYEVISLGRHEHEDIKIDLLNEGLTDIIQDCNPDVICHFASSSNIAQAGAHPEAEFKNVVSGTKNLIDSIKHSKCRIRKIIYLSSQAVYGVPEYLPVDEKHPLNPKTIYGQYKLKAEELIKQSQIPFLIFRVSSVYGSNQSYKKSGAIASFLYNIENGMPPVIFNSPDSIVDFVYVKDVVSAIALALTKDDMVLDVLNLASGIPVRLKDVLDVIYKYFPNAPGPELHKNDLYLGGKDKGIFLDISKITQWLKWKCNYNIEEGLNDMLSSCVVKGIY